jgi:hypothetical protein
VSSRGLIGSALERGRGVDGGLVASLAGQTREAGQVDEDDRGRSGRVRDLREPAGGEEPLEPFDDPGHTAVLEVPGGEPHEHLRREPDHLCERDPHVVRELIELATQQTLPDG